MASKRLGLAVMMAALSGTQALGAPCYSYAAGRLMQLANGSLESCIRTVVATGSGSGLWGPHRIQIDRHGQAYVDGQFFGRARSSREEGTASPYNRWAGQEQRNWNYYRNNQLPLTYR